MTIHEVSKRLRKLGWQWQRTRAADNWVIPKIIAEACRWDEGKGWAEITYHLSLPWSGPGSLKRKQLAAEALLGVLEETAEGSSG